MPFVETSAATGGGSVAVSEQLGLGESTVPNSASTALAFLPGGVTTLEFTDLTAPTAIEAGLYAITVNVYTDHAPVAGKTANITLSMDDDNLAVPAVGLLPLDSDLGEGAVGSASIVFHLPVGGKVVVYAFHLAGVDIDLYLAGSVVKIA